MSLPHIRPWATATARCSRRTRPSQTLKKAVRYVSGTQVGVVEEKPLESMEDWTNFQLKRAGYQSLIEQFSAYGSTQTRQNSFQPHHPLNRPVAPSNITLSTLLASGAHFGHSQSLMNPNFMPYAYGPKWFEASPPKKDPSSSWVHDLTSAPPSARLAERVGPLGYHVGERWLPGTLTNKNQMFGVEIGSEVQVAPDLVIFLNPIPNMHAIRECALEHVPTIGIVDSNVDPRIVMYPIPANDESTRTAELIAGVLGIAGREGAALAREEHLKRPTKQR
ncbi:37S ribosomal protein MRP4, mitochondrial [Grifola frondosa]|uniref:37S ribosomal protein MRP4, mitochondrial n=1 Tax=Grifola frondosa TaxID=5627 RepID=A0A1C7MF95_GRIFR|nr:37S ribosomal protein MRP4, mitochondrial [Grifola frondosa]